MAMRNALIFAVWLLALTLSSGVDSSLAAPGFSRPANAGAAGARPSGQVGQRYSTGALLTTLTRQKTLSALAVAPAQVTIKLQRSFPKQRDTFIVNLKKLGMKAAKKALKEALEYLLGSDSDSSSVTSDNIVPVCTNLQGLFIQWPNVQACINVSGYNLYSLLLIGLPPTQAQRPRLCQPECLKLVDPIVKTAIQPCGFINSRMALYVDGLVNMFQGCSQIQVQASSVSLSLPEIRGAASSSGSSAGPPSANATANKNSTSLKESTGALTVPPAAEKTVPTPSPSRKSGAYTLWTSVNAVALMMAAALAVVMA